VRRFLRTGLLVEALHAGRDVFLLFGQFLGRLQRVLDVALGPPVLLARELLLRVLQLVESGLRGGAAVLCAVGRRLTHRVRGILQLLGRFREIRTLLLTRQLLQLSCGFFRFLRECRCGGASTARPIAAVAVQRAGARSACC
jgi:hypothetical protein